ncbi:MAG: hypothetical protein M1836_002403 [Candelina mexicana]|nr:MAG: hypothetical protein M1836_002403 [Candelina mexicana]
MSGNFDYPPASSTADPQNPSSSPLQFPSTASNGLPNVPASLQHLREILSSERRERERANQVTEGSSARASYTNPSAMSSDSHDPVESRRRRAIIREVTQQVHNQLPSARVTSHRTNIPGASLRARPRASPSERYLQRHRQQQEAQQSTALTGLRQAGASLTEAGSNLSNLSALLEDAPRISSPSITAQEYSGEAEVNRRRFKRRKLENEGLKSEYQGFNYGHFGQVVPGRLKMEIVSCDGGNYPKERPGDKDHPAENVLNNDKSVYCTKSNRCNLVLRHQGETTFCLKKLVVKAPQRGFTAPVQEGMVFISMTSDDLLARTAQYRIHYTTPLRHQLSTSMPPAPDPIHSTPGSAAPGWHSSQRPYLENSNANSTLSDRDQQDPLSRERYSSLASHLWSGAASASFDRSLFEAIQVDNNSSLDTDAAEECDYLPINLDSASQNVSAPTPPPFTVTTECSDDSGDEEVASSPATMADRLRRDSLWYSPSEVEDDDDDGLGLAEPGPPLMGPPGHRPARRRVIPSRIEARPEPPSQAHAQVQTQASATEEEVKQEDDVQDQEIMAPHARFFIRRERSMISIKFDPPV